MTYTNKEHKRQYNVGLSRKLYADPIYRAEKLRRQRETYAKNSEVRRNKAAYHKEQATLGNWGEGAALRRDKKLKKAFGISLADYERILSEQDYGCASCGKLEAECGGRNFGRLVVDHDHETGNIRGLLCYQCNLGVGNLGDNLVGVEKAAAYLRKYHGK